MIGNLICCNNIHWGNKDLCHCSMDVSWLHDIVPSKIKSNLNCHCQLTCDDWGIPNTKLKYCQCTSAALLCCKNTELFNCIWQILTHEWWIWIVLFIPRCYKTSLSSGGCFCAFEILVALATKTDLGTVVYTGSLSQGRTNICKECIKPICHWFLVSDNGVIYNKFGRDCTSFLFINHFFQNPPGVTEIWFIHV